MARWSRSGPWVGADRVVAALGGLYVAAAVGRVLPAASAGEPPVDVVLDFVQIAGPGAALLYGGFALSRTDVRPDAYGRVLLWCLGTAGALLLVVGLLVADPDLTVNQPVWAALLATSVGNLGGLVIGVNEARAVSRAREAREHERELERQNDRLESFASMLAHELRNPLNVAQLYLPQAAEGDADAAEEVEAALDRIDEMVDVLLVTARGDDSDVDAEVVSLSAVATDAWADLHADRATLVVDADRYVRTDPVHLRHVLENLFRNAIEHGSANRQPSADDAVEHGSTSARSSTDDGVTVRIGDLPDGFYVADDGTGIPADEREKVFDAGHTTGADGFGLGLTIVARLAETYDWDCELTESEAGGVRFEFRDVEPVAPGDSPAE